MTTKTVRVPEELVEPIKALVRLHKNKARPEDFAVLNIAIARTAWCVDQDYDVISAPMLKQSMRSMRKLIDQLRLTPPTDRMAIRNWDRADLLREKLAEFEKISGYGID